MNFHFESGFLVQWQTYSWVDKSGAYFGPNLAQAQVDSKMNVANVNMKQKMKQKSTVPVGCPDSHMPIGKLG